MLSFCSCSISCLSTLLSIRVSAILSHSSSISSSGLSYLIGTVSTIILPLIHYLMTLGEDYILNQLLYYLYLHCLNSYLMFHSYYLKSLNVLYFLLNLPLMITTFIYNCFSYQILTYYYFCYCFLSCFIYSL